MIKVLHYLKHLGLGGTEKTCQLFFEYAGQDFEVAVAYEKNGEHPRLDEFRKSALVSNGKLYCIDNNLQEVIDAIKPDIFHVYRSGYHEAPSPGHHINVPHFVVTNVFGFYDSNPNINRDLFMSEWLMNETVKKLGFKPSRFDFINNPVENPWTDATLPIAERWKESNVIIVGRCGRPDNGIYNSVSVDAVRLLRMQGYDIRFLVVAPPSNMIDDLSRYDIPFYMIEPTVNPLVLSTFYNSVDIYTHARADGETFGVNIAEAMIHSKPVITHIAVPSIPGMGVFQAQAKLVDNNVTGFVVNNTPAEYAEALKTLIDDKDMRLEMGKKGEQKAIREFEASVCVRKLERIYREVVL